MIQPHCIAGIKLPMRTDKSAAIGTAGPPLEGWEDEAADSGYGDW